MKLVSLYFSARMLAIAAAVTMAGATISSAEEPTGFSCRFFASQAFGKEDGHEAHDMLAACEALQAYRAAVIELVQVAQPVKDRTFHGVMRVVMKAPSDWVMARVARDVGVWEAVRRTGEDQTPEAPAIAGR